MSPVGRRALLLGGAGALLAGCGSAEKGGVPVNSDRFASGSFDSRAMKRPIGWTLSYPVGQGIGNVLPTVIALHGRGGDHRTALTTLNLDHVLEGSRSFVLATIDGGDHSYYHRRTDGTDFAAMLVDEFVPVLRSHQLTTSAIGYYGWSMGGYGALLLASNGVLDPRAVAVSSPALFADAGATPAGAFDSAEDFERNDVYGGPQRLAGVPVHLDCGTNDPFRDATADFAGRLTGTVESRFPAGGHGAAYWRRAAPTAFRFLDRHLR